MQGWAIRTKNDLFPPGQWQKSNIHVDIEPRVTKEHLVPDGCT